MIDFGSPGKTFSIKLRPSVFLRNEAYFLKVEREGCSTLVYGPMPSLEWCSMVWQEIVEHTSDSLESAVENLKKALEEADE